MRYEVLVGDTVIGWSELEYGDPPMGVAFGVLHPTAEYTRLTRTAALRVRPEGGAFFEASGGVHIEDQSAKHGTTAIEVSVLGLDANTYERYFSVHVKAYEERLAN